MKIVCVLVALLFVNSCVGHSWLDCVNVTDTLTVTSLANIKCNGYPRGYVGRSVPDDNMWKIEGITQAQFLATNACRWTYSSTYPMLGSIKPGESMTIAYTPNGHTTWASTAPPRGPQNFTIRWSGVAGSDLQTMQDVINAPSLLTVQFDTPCHSRVTGAQLDAASGICQADVTIPKGTPAGTYQLVWWWPFRYASASVIEDYTTCWDVTVVADSSSTTGSSSTTSKSTSGSSTTSGTASTSASATTGSSTTGSSTTTYSDLVIISKAPTTVKSSGIFNVSISYVASASRDIVVDLMDTNENWYGKGTATIASGKGSKIITVAVQNSPSQSSSYQLHAWIVGAGQADVTNAWNSAFDNDYQSLAVGSSLVTSC